MALRSLLAVISATALLGCVETTGGATGGTPAMAAPGASVLVASDDPAIKRYNRVVARMERVAEGACQRRVRARVSCDFLIVLDQDPRQPANAYQSLGPGGQPVLTFTVAILQEMQNDHEMAFVLGHEAAHHIKGHIGQTQQTAIAGGVLGAGLAVLLGGGETAIDLGMDLGGTVGARAYSKDHELEADALGARIAHDAGYNPVLGAEFFNRIPDPGNRFLGSHPPNAERIATVKRAAATF